MVIIATLPDDCNCCYQSGAVAVVVSFERFVVMCAFFMIVGAAAEISETETKKSNGNFLVWFLVVATKNLQNSLELKGF